jgi:hypothetical protein
MAWDISREQEGWIPVILLGMGVVGLYLYGKHKYGSEFQPFTPDPEPELEPGVQGYPMGNAVRYRRRPVR